LAQPPVLGALALDPDRLSQEIDVVNLQPEQLADPESGAGECHDDGAPAVVDRVG